MARRKRLNWGPVLVLLTCVNVALGLAYSPMTSATKVRVEGAYATDQQRIREAVQLIRKKPALRGGAEKTIEQILRRPDVRNVSFGQNLFRRGLIKVTYFQPVARVEGMPKTVLTAQGSICQTQEPIDDLPPVRFASAMVIPTATLVERIESKKVADVCARASTLKIANLEILVLESGGLCLNSGKTGRVILGTPDELDEKFEALDRALAAQPDLLNQQKEIVLIVPSKPAQRPLGETPR
jgi:hypothetical protein